MSDKPLDNLSKDELIALVQSLQQQLESAYPCADIGVIDGKQDIYDFIISLE